MARVEANNFDVFSKDETGAFVTISFTCPYCGYDNVVDVFIGEEKVDFLDHAFEIDQTCESCGETATVECI